jgi:hypothetical protein
LALAAFRLGLNLGCPWCEYSGTPRHLDDRFVHHPPQQKNGTTIRLRAAAVEHCTAPHGAEDQMPWQLLQAVRPYSGGRAHAARNNGVNETMGSTLYLVAKKWGQRFTL